MMRTLLVLALLSASPVAAQHSHAMQHDMPSAPDAPPIGPPPPGALSGPEHAADTVFPPEVMAKARAQTIAAHGDVRTHFILIDRLEWAGRAGADLARLSSEGRFGGDSNRLWLKADAETHPGNGGASAELQMLYGRAIHPYWDIEAGIRQDLGPGPDRTHAVLGLHGLAPYWFEVSATAFLSTKGELTAEVGASYDQRITNRLILEPWAELSLAAQDITDLGTASGLTEGELGLRLRHEIVPEFAPYVGVSLERKLGQTASLAKAAGEATGGWSVLLGVRAWF